MTTVVAGMPAVRFHTPARPICSPLAVTHETPGFPYKEHGWPLILTKSMGMAQLPVAPCTKPAPILRSEKAHAATELVELGGGVVVVGGKVILVGGPVTVVVVDEGEWEANCDVPHALATTARTTRYGIVCSRAFTTTERLWPSSPGQGSMR